MFDRLPARLALIGGVLVLFVGLLLTRGVTRGLDLQGGTHLALEVDDSAAPLTPEKRADVIDQALHIIRSRVDELGVSEPVVQKSGNERIIVELAGATEEDQRRAKEVISKTAFLKFQIVRPSDELTGAMGRIDRAVLEAFPAEAQAAPARPTSPVGGLLQPQTDTTAGADTAAVARPFSSKVQPLAQAGLFGVETENVAAVQRYLAHPNVQRALPRGTQLRWGVPDPTQPAFRTLYLLDAQPMLTGEYLERAQAQPDPQFGRPVVAFGMNRQGARRFGAGTGANIGNQMAIVLDERVYSAPVIQSQISNSGQIEMGNATLAEARDLALVLRAGALPAPIRIIEERTVGPSLGADSIRKGQIAGIIGIIGVILIMIGYYRFAGFLSIVALSIYMALVLGGLAGLGAVLTFPGIAGLVLSIGMAVDANVLIFERIREELAAGRSPRTAVSEGFGHALSAIVDSNLTTLITAVILYYIGTGPVRGFAVTLGIGILASMFTAIFVTRTLFLLYLERRGATQQALSI
ncbi:MAG: protein translocase subunit SecD [Gemmatimonadota bacterium]|nr:protein translocase subunit SecD [Gemmatimonadota bacterium]